MNESTENLRVIDLKELNRLQECERAWQAIFNTLKEGNHGTFHGPGTGVECAVREIRRLQIIVSRHVITEADLNAALRSAA